MSDYRMFWLLLIPMSASERELDLVAETRRNWAKRGLSETEAMVAATSLARAQQITLGRINQALVEHGLTFSRYEALALLSFARNQSMGMSRVGERLQVHPTSVTSTIDRLERDGLVARTPNPNDRRSTLVALTTAGAEVLDKATASLEAIRWGMGEIDDADLTALIGGLGQLRASAGDVVHE